MTPKEATAQTYALLHAFGLRDWIVITCDNAAIALLNGGSATEPNGDPIQGLTSFRMKTIFLSETYCLIDQQAWELIEHEVSHALSHESVCENNPKFDAAAKRIDEFYKAAEFGN